MSDQNWKQFEMSGKIEDYLLYKNVQYQTEKKRSGKGRASESVNNSDRNGNLINTNKRI